MKNILLKKKGKIGTMRKIVFSTILCFTVVMFLTVTPYAATNLGILSYWHSDKDLIGRWDKRSIDICFDKLNTDTSFYFVNGMTHGCREWDDVTGITFNRNLSNTSSPIVFYGGTLGQIYESTGLTIDNKLNGVTYYTYTREGIWQYGSSSKTGCKITNAVGYIIDKGHTIEEYRNTCTHELGHALGWFGHSGNSSDIMYSLGTSVTSLTARDVNHLSQIY